jgi:DNA polymerase (family 10)
MKSAKFPVNIEIAELLRSVAASYELKEPETSKFKIIAYQRAADAVEHASSELKDLWDDGKLQEVPGIGKSIAEHLDGLFRKGESFHFKKIMSGIPRAVFTLIRLPQIGPKSAYKLVKELKLSEKNPVEDLEKAAKKGEIAQLSGFGESSQSEILKVIQETKRRTRRHLLPYAISAAADVIEWLKKSSNIKGVDPLGSLRRWTSTVGDIDIAVASENPGEAIEHFIEYPKAQRVLEQGKHTTSILLPGNVQIDLMIQPPSSYGALLQHFTGSKHHNIVLREYAIKKGMSLSEYGIKVKNKLKKFSSEEEFYKTLGMDWISPELREDSGEIEASLRHQLPKLLELKDVKADLHIHSDFNIETSHDVGESSAETLIKKADALGYEYIVFSEHNPSKSQHSSVQTRDILSKKKKTIEKINYSIVKNKYKRIKKVFNSLEIDILPDGKLAIDEKAIDLLDFALVSIHSSFRSSRLDNTKRVLAALSHPKVKILSHPTTRRLNQREGIELEWPKIFEFCLRNNKWLEINADPIRLDLPDVLVKEAINFGVKITLGTDAHHVDGLDDMIYGVSVARRGWAKSADIINTRNLIEFEKMLK